MISELKLGRPALLSMEMQRGVIGDLAPMPQIAGVAQEMGIPAKLGALMDTCRRANIPVVHCNAEYRHDLKGTGRNARILAAMTKKPDNILEGSPGAELVEGLRVEPEDIVIRRLHGMTPFTATSLDQILRNMKVDTVIATGVSLNFGVFGMCLSAIDLGYRVVVVRDCMAGYPREYGEAIVDNSLSMIAAITDAAALTEAIAAGGATS